MGNDLQNVQKKIALVIEFEGDTTLLEAATKGMSVDLFNSMLGAYVRGCKCTNVYLKKEDEQNGNG